MNQADPRRGQSETATTYSTISPQKLCLILKELRFILSQLFEWSCFGATITIKNFQ